MKMVPKMDPTITSENDDRFKVVFLIDTRNVSTKQSDNKSSQLCISAIKLSVLKLLTFFANGTTGQATHLRWGYKLFNSILSAPPCKRETFKEFTESHVDIFEEQLLEDFEAGVHLQKGSKLQVKSEDKRKIRPVDSVKNAFNLAVQDFQWEGPDIRSPVKSAHLDGISKRTRTRSVATPLRSNDSQNSKSNFTFLLMAVPHHSANVKDFLGVAKDSDANFSAEEIIVWAMPEEAGLREKIKQKGINIFWIDTANLQTQNQEVPKGDGHGLRITSEAMYQLGVKVLPIQTLHNLGNKDLNLFLKSIPDTKQASVASTSSAGEECPDDMEGYEDGEEKSEKRGQGRYVARSFFPWSAVIRRCVMGDRVEYGDDYLVLCSKKDSGMVPRCKLKVQPLFESPTGSVHPDASVPQILAPPSSRTSIKSPSKHARKGRPLSITARTQNIAFQISTPSPDEMSASSKIKPDGNLKTKASPRKLGKDLKEDKTVVIQGVVPTRSLFLGVHYEDTACLCTGVVLQDEDSSVQKPQSSDADDISEQFQDRTQTLSTWFKKLMMDLNQKKLALLVDMEDPISALPQSAILEPLTSVTASLRLIKPNMIRSVERMMQVYHGIMNPERKDRQRGITAKGKGGAVSDRARLQIESVTKRCVKEHVRGQRLRRNLSSKTFSPTVTSSLHGRAQKAMTRFNPHQLESWYHNGSTHGVSTKFLEHLKEIPEDTSKQQGCTAVDQLLYDLEVMYDTQVRNPDKEAKPSPVKVPEVKKVKPKKTLNVNDRVVSIVNLSKIKQATKKKSPEKAKEDENKAVTNAYVQMVRAGTSKHKSEEDLVKYLQATYKRYLSGFSRNGYRLNSMVEYFLNAIKLKVKTDLITFIFMIMKPILLYAKSKCIGKDFTGLTEELVEHARQILTKALLIDNTKLREIYKNMLENDSKERRAKEIEVQVLLRLEMEALLPTKIEDKNDDKDKKTADDETEESEENPLDVSMSEEIDLPDHIQDAVDEMVTMLQSIPIWVDHSRLTTFLEDAVSNYHQTLRPILTVIYNDLMITKPAQLMSPSQKVKSSVKKQPKSFQQPLSFESGMMSSSVAGQRSRSLVRHPSFDVGSKRVIPVVIKKEAMKKPKEKKKLKKEPEDDQAKRVCRNLFSGGSESPLRRSPRKKVSLTRRQSIAVMETTAKETAAHRWKSPRRLSPGKSPSRLVLKTRVVKETPGKKQVLQAMLKKQDRARKHLTSETISVGESPDKIVKETPHPKRSTPGKRHVRHHSHKTVFYSQNSAKAKATLLAAKIRGKVPPPQPVNSIRHLNIPGKVPPSQLENSTLNLNIPGKVPPSSQSVSNTRHMHARAKSTSALHRVFSNFASPNTLMHSRKIRPRGEDSPSKNTRSQVDLVPDVLPSPKSRRTPSKSPSKSSKRTPSKSPRRLANRALWRSPNKDDTSQETQKVKVIETPEKLEVKGLSNISPVKQHPDTTPQKSLDISPKKTAKKSSPRRSPLKQSTNKTPKKCPKLVVKRTPRRGWSLRGTGKTPDKEIKTIPSVSDETMSPRKILKNSTNLSPVPKLQALKLSATQAVSNEDTARPPCERCIESVTHSHASRGFSSSTSLLNPSEISTVSSLEDVFESPPPPNLKSPLRKSTRKTSSGTPELNKMWKQKKPHNSGSPISSKILSPKSSVRSESPVFGPEPTPPRKGNISPLAFKNRPNIIMQSPAATRMTSSPIFGKQTPSPHRKRPSRSPASTSKQSAKRATKKQKKSDTSSPSILSYLDIKGMKLGRDPAPQRMKLGRDPAPHTLLEVADYQHGAQDRGRKRGRSEEDDELTSTVKRQKSMQDEEKSSQDDNLACAKDVDDFVDVEIDCDANDDEVLFISTPKSRINISEVATEGTSVEELQEFVSPSRKTKSIVQDSPAENVMSPQSSKSPNVETMETSTLAAQVDNTESKCNKHKSFRRLPTRRSLVKKTSSENTSTSDPMELPLSPMYSDDSMEDDIPSVAQTLTPTAGSGDTKKKQYTPVSKKGLSDLINSPLISSSKKKIVGSRERGSRRHVSFSSE